MAADLLNRNACLHALSANGICWELGIGPMMIKASTWLGNWVWQRKSRASNQINFHSLCWQRPFGMGITQWTRCAIAFITIFAMCTVHGVIGCARDENAPNLFRFTVSCAQTWYGIRWEQFSAKKKYTRYEPLCFPVVAASKSHAYPDTTRFVVSLPRITKLLCCRTYCF